MHLKLSIRDNMNDGPATRRITSGVTACGVEYSLYRGCEALYLFLTLSKQAESKEIAVTVDVPCAAIKKSFLPVQLDPLNISMDAIKEITETDEVKEKNIEFTTGIGLKCAVTNFRVNLVVGESYLLTIK